MSKPRKWRGLALRVAISVIGLAAVAFVVDVPAALRSLASIHLGGFIAGVLIFQVGIFVRAWRWWVLLRSHDDDTPYWPLARLYYIGMFFNLFLPTGFGGDVVRATELGTSISPATAAATVLLDRMLGLMGLFAIALTAAPFALAVVPGNILLLTAAVSIVGLVGGGLVLQGGLFGAVLRVLDGWTARVRPLNKLVGAFVKFNASIATVGGDRGGVAGAFGISLLFNVLLIGMHIIFSYALGLTVPPLPYLLIVPITSILLLVPSIQGLGVREGTFVVLMTQFGADEAAALALSLAIYLPSLITGLLGFGVYLAYALQKPTETVSQSSQGELPQ